MGAGFFSSGTQMIYCSNWNVEMGEGNSQKKEMYLCHISSHLQFQRRGFLFVFIFSIPSHFVDIFLYFT